MSKEVICTIITGNYGHYAMALHDSLLTYNKKMHFAIFISEGELNEKVKTEITKRKNIIVYDDDDFTDIEVAEQLRHKYKTSNNDAYRWGMKPIFLIYLLGMTYERAIYVDSDIYFFNDYSFLFKQLEQCSILLSPHWRCSDPTKDIENFKLNFLDGIYNGGFIGSSKSGKNALLYWAKLCFFKCEVNRNEGFYVDQRYLDILPTRFESVDYIRHKGCNLAYWNQVDCKRTLNPDGVVLINEIEPIVFIHFTNSFFKGVFLESDSLLLPYLEKYRDTILKYCETDLISEFFKEGIHLKSRTEEVEPQKNTNEFNKHLKKITHIFKKLKKAFIKY